MVKNLISKQGRKCNYNECTNCNRKTSSWTICKTCQDNAHFKNKVKKKLETLDKRYTKNPTLKTKTQIGILWSLLND